MKALKFTLEGKTAFFKKPDVNTYLYFTYGNIHKVAILGLLGAVLGYKGYNQMKREMDTTKKKVDYPEFYIKLNNLKIGVVPNNEKGIISKKGNKFNNSVGYASQEKGGNLIVTEQWLENPSWDIYILLDCEEAEKVKDALLNKSYVYLPYLGKNDHPANISGVEKLEVKETEEFNKVNSFFIKDSFEFTNELNNEENPFANLDNDEEILEFKYEEKLPTALTKETNSYILTSLIFTNKKVKSIKNDNIIFKINDSIVQFI